MAIQTLAAILEASAAVQALCAGRISPVIRQQSTELPAVVLERTAVNPVNNLDGHAGLDQNQVQIESRAHTYKKARMLADACRTAIQAAGYVMDSEFDNYEPSVDPGEYCITQVYSVWL